MPVTKSTCRSKILQTQDFLRPIITDGNTKDASFTTGTSKEIDVFPISRPTLKARVHAWGLLCPFLRRDIAPVGLAPRPEAGISGRQIVQARCPQPCRPHPYRRRPVSRRCDNGSWFGRS